MGTSVVSPPEQGQLVNVRSRQRIVNDVSPSTLPPPALKPFFSGRQHLLTLASVKVTADQCPRIPAAFLVDERRAMGERWYRQEYLCSFEDVIDALFSYEDITSALDNHVAPLFPEAP
jgi:hypothetical protein